MQMRVLYKIGVIGSVIAGLAGAAGCTSGNASGRLSERYRFSQILDIRHTPSDTTRCYGCYTDAGSWMGFTLPSAGDSINGFCGPFSIDRRYFMAKSVLTVAFKDGGDLLVPDSVHYLPGECFIQSRGVGGAIQQRLWFIDATTALLEVSDSGEQDLVFKADGLHKDATLSKVGNQIWVRHPSGESLVLTFEPDMRLSAFENNYEAVSEKGKMKKYVALSFLTHEKDSLSLVQNSSRIIKDPGSYINLHDKRWDGYLGAVLRNDMPDAYDRIAVKSVMTLISNWRAQRGGLLHDGVVPSHGVGYFVGFWAWDSWRFSVALAPFAPELAKNNIRAMFDYQQPDGMVIDCIYTDSSENNARDSKPPLASWAVDAVFEHTGDTAFVREMYPQLKAYYRWWYDKRDHDGNKMCEFGSADGTVEAAAWESGMDNAIRFDEARMVRNDSAAYSFDQESVDLNAYLALEHRLLTKFARLIGTRFDEPYYGDRTAGYFFDEERGFFFDRRLKDGSFVREEGCEAYIPLWTRIASEEQVARMMVALEDTGKFNTYIPFPTVAADNPKFMPKGYWRGPIWLDQTYFAIRGLRNYGYDKEADNFTLRVFDRLDGLTGMAPIHENYGTHTGERLKAPHFSWSAAHLLMMYADFGN